jgi:hypothetical protein
MAFRSFEPRYHMKGRSDRDMNPGPQSDRCGTFHCVALTAHITRGLVKMGGRYSTDNINTDTEMKT